MLVNGESEGTSGEKAVVYFKVLCRHLQEGTEEVHKNTCVTVAGLA